MGEAADDALERAEREWDHFQEYKDAPFDIQYDEGLIDETGAIIGDLGSFPSRFSENLRDIF